MRRLSRVSTTVAPRGRASTTSVERVGAWGGTPAPARAPADYTPSLAAFAASSAILAASDAAAREALDIAGNTGGFLGKASGR